MVFLFLTLIIGNILSELKCKMSKFFVKVFGHTWFDVGLKSIMRFFTFLSSIPHPPRPFIPILETPKHLPKKNLEKNVKERGCIGDTSYHTIIYPLHY